MRSRNSSGVPSCVHNPNKYRWWIANRFAIRNVAALGVSILLVSCASLGGKGEYREKVRAGDYEGAEEIAREYNLVNDQLLRLMHLGTINQLQEDYETSNQQFEEGKSLASRLAAISVSETAAALTVNQRVSKFGGNRFERLMLFFYKALNYLELGDPVAARVEMSQAELLLREWKTNAVDYPFLPLFLGIIYEILDERDNAVVAYRRAVDSYRESGFVPLIAQRLYIDLLAEAGYRDELAKASAEFGISVSVTTDIASRGDQAKLVILSARGLMTPLSSFYIPFFSPDIRANLLIGLPLYSSEYSLPSPPYRQLQQLNITGFGESAPEATSLVLAEENLNNSSADPSPDDRPVQSQEIDWTAFINVEEEMRRALEQRMPAITALAVARAIIKKGIEEGARQADDSGIFGALVVLANIATESFVDTRSWDILPQAFYMSYLVAEPGSYRLGSDSFELEEGMNIFYLPGS